MTPDQRKQVAREILNWDPGSAISRASPLWLYPLLEVLMLRGWRFVPDSRPGAEPPAAVWHWYSIYSAGWKGAAGVEKTLGEAINAAGVAALDQPQPAPPQPPTP